MIRLENQFRRAQADASPPRWPRLSPLVMVVAVIVIVAIVLLVTVTHRS